LREHDRGVHRVGQVRPATEVDSSWRIEHPRCPALHSLIGRTGDNRRQCVNFGDQLSTNTDIGAAVTGQPDSFPQSLANKRRRGGIGRELKSNISAAQTKNCGWIECPTAATLDRLVGGTREGRGVGAIDKDSLRADGAATTAAIGGDPGLVNLLPTNGSRDAGRNRGAE